MGDKAKRLLSKRPLMTIEQCLLETPGERKRKVDDGTDALPRPCSKAKHGEIAKGTDVEASSSGKAMAQPHSMVPKSKKRGGSTALPPSKRANVQK